MSDLDPRIEVVRDRYGLRREDFWELPQKKGTWVAKHAALEVAAVKAEISFDMPVVIESDANGLVTSLIVQGTMGGRSEWSIGETNPTNYKVSGKQPSYPWAMAEKRAKDRVILKLIGIHGLVYSEDEVGDDARQETAPKQPSKDAARDLFTKHETAIRAATTKDELRTAWSAAMADKESIPLDWQPNLVAERDAKILALGKAAAPVKPSFDHLQTENA